MKKVLGYQEKSPEHLRVYAKKLWVVGNNHWNTKKIHLSEPCKEPDEVQEAYEVLLTEEIIENFGVIPNILRCGQVGKRTVNAFNSFLTFENDMKIIHTSYGKQEKEKNEKKQNFSAQGANLARVLHPSIRATNTRVKLAGDDIQLTSFRDVMMRIQK